MESTESREGAPLAELDDNAESVQQSGSDSGSSNNLAAPVEEAPSGSPTPQPLPSSSPSSGAPVQPDPTVVERTDEDQQIIDLTERLDRARLGPAVEAVAVGGEAPIVQEEDDEVEDREEEVAHEVDGAELDDANADGHVDVQAGNEAEGAVVVAAVDNIPNGRWLCRLVGCLKPFKAFSSEQSRNRHEETKHSEIRPYQCNLPNIDAPALACKTFFKFEHHVKAHLKSEHQPQEIRLGHEFILFPELVRERHEEWKRKLREAGFL